LAKPGPVLTRAGDAGPRLLFIEPYANASHRALLEGLLRHIPARWTALTLPGRHFRWRLRGAACFLALAAAEVLSQEWDGLVCSSMLGLAELRGLAPALSRVPALVYFHENQLCYPAPGQAGAEQQGRDLFLAWSNLTSIQAACLAVFNSAYQRDGFLEAARALLAQLPDAAPPGLARELEAKCRVLPVPLEVGEAAGLTRRPRQGPLRILWNHRWSQDKGPEEFFAALEHLEREGSDYELAMLGPSSGRPPRAFAQARTWLGPRLRQWGAVSDRQEYWRWLLWADVAVSCARQENQGLSVAEAAWAGCGLLLPRAQVYPWLYPEACLYQPGGLAPALAALARQPQATRQGPGLHGLAQAWTWPALAAAWGGMLAELTEAGA
jgi:glycosyltransferase involved in cell wall biosynthesis